MPVNPDISSGGANVVEALWEAASTSNLPTVLSPAGLLPLAGSVQVTGTFGGATVTLQGSNDGTNFVTLKDTSGNDISMTAAGAVDFSTAMQHIKPNITGGTSDDLDITVVMRG